MSETLVYSSLFVILGATGDLTGKKLFPAIYSLSDKGQLKDRIIILGAARKDLNDDSFRALTYGMLKSAGLSIDNRIYSNWCKSCLYYQSLGQGRVEDYANLASKIKGLEQEKSLPGNRVFYLALPTNVLSDAVTGLGEAGLNRSSGWTRLVIEKPFGRDLASARELRNLIHRYFDESQIYRIDHYLGKETVQNLLVLRFANTFFEDLWNREHIESIEITVAEKVGVEERSNYYEQTGALRDMVQNHLTQLLTLVAMEPPIAFEAEAVRNEKVKLLRQILPIQEEDVVFGQYSHGKIDVEEVAGYREERNVARDSKIETFVAMKLKIANWRWKDVIFYLRTGKRLPQKLTQIVVNFHCAPVSIFQPFESECAIEPNALVMTLQPDEGFSLKFQVKSIGHPIVLTNQWLRFRYSEAFGQLPDAYETLLLDIVNGDQTLFVRYDEVELAWKLYDALLDKSIPINLYPAGTWGPRESDQLHL